MKESGLARVIIACVICSVLSVHHAAAQAGADTGTETPPIPPAGSEPSAAIEVDPNWEICVAGLDEIIKKFPIFLETLCGGTNDIVKDNTTASVPPLFPAEVGEFWIDENKV